MFPGTATGKRTKENILKSGSHANCPMNIPLLLNDTRGILFVIQKSLKIWLINSEI